MVRFKYYNINPEGDKIGDCVCRAISFASKIPYNVIKYKLKLNAELYECDFINKFCYSHFIEDVLGYKQVNCDNLTVREFAELHPFGTYLIRIQGHLTCIKDAVCYDIWNCLDELCDIVWEVD